MKKYLWIIAILIILSIGISVIATVTNEQQLAANRLNRLGILRGDGSGNLLLSNTLTRTEFATVAIRFMGFRDDELLIKTLPYSDIPFSFWGIPYISMARELNIMQGVGNNRFAPNASITRAEVVTILIRALGYAPSSNVWPNGYLDKAVELRLITEYGAFSSPLTRGEMSIIVSRALDIPFLPYVQLIR